MPLHEIHRKKRGKNLLIAGILVALVVLFFLITVVKLGPGVFERPL